jgi:hypothetical protein
MILHEVFPKHMESQYYWRRSELIKFSQFLIYEWSDGFPQKLGGISLLKLLMPTAVICDITPA